jgi:hypothetical protein
MRTRRWMGALALAAGLAATACSSDVNKPENVNPQAVATGISGLTDQFSSNLAFQSLAGLSASFGYGAVSAAATAAVAVLPPLPGGSRGFALSAEQRAALLRLSLRTPAAEQAIFPVNVLGRTLVWDTTLNKYVVDSTATGAPSNGVRFKLYLVGDTVLHRPQKPLIVVGYVDLTDLSNAQANKLGVLIKYLSQTIADYTITGTLTTSGLGLGAQGYITDGTARLDFDLQVEVTLAGVTLNYTLTGSNGFQAIVQASFDSGTGATTLLWRVASGRNSVELDLTATDSVATGQILFNGVMVATVTGSETDPTIVASSGHPLTPQDIESLRSVFAGFTVLMDQVNGVFGPAHLVFNF